MLFDKLKNNIAEILVILAVFSLALFSTFTIFGEDKNEAYAEDTSNYKEALSSYLTFRDIKDIYPDYSEYGCTSIYEMSDLLEANKQNSATISDDIIDKYRDIISEDQKSILIEKQNKIIHAITLKRFYEIESEINAIKDELEAKRIELDNANKQTDPSNYVLPSGSSVLTKSKGVNSFNGRTETWYSTREPGQTTTAYPIPGRWTGSDGIIRDKDGYICVAASDLAPYSVVETSLGLGKVYDCGCRKGITDIYTEW